jgi:NitT/TauT family transport system permease protein
MPLSHLRPDAQRELATRSIWWIDLLIVIGLAALVAGVVALARRWSAPLLPAVEIDLSLWSLPGYTLLSLARGVAAYILSLAFTLIYGSVAAHHRVAERVMIPVLDILQGIRAGLPGLVLGMVALFRTRTSASSSPAW